MDTRTAKVDVKPLIEEIKQFMPETYKAIQQQSYLVGNGAFELVRRSLRGEPNCFYAIERGRVMGTPFAVSSITDFVARQMVEFGCAYVCIWPVPENQQTAGVANGTN